MDSLFRALAIVLAAAIPGQAQQYLISTVAGGLAVPTPAPASGLFGTASGMTVDATGNLYVATFQNAVYKIDTQGDLTRVAGNGRYGYSGDGGPAANAELYYPGGITIDAAGDLFVMQGVALQQSAIRKVSTNGIITTVAGNGANDYSIGTFPFEGAPAVNAGFHGAVSVAADGNGNLFIADFTGYRVLKVAPTGIITALAGNGVMGYSGDGGPALQASMYPYFVAADPAGNVFIADTTGSIRKVSLDGTISTVAGTGTVGYSGDGGPAKSAQLNTPFEVALDTAGDLFIAEDGSQHDMTGRIRKVSPNGAISTVYTGRVSAMTADAAGDLFIAGSMGSTSGIYELSAAGVLSTIGANGSLPAIVNGSPAAQAYIFNPGVGSFDGAGNFYFTNGGAILKISPAGTIATVPGNGSIVPGNLTADSAGNLYFFNSNNFSVVKISTTGTVSTIAGGVSSGPGAPGSTGDGGPATQAQIGIINSGLTVDSAGNLYIAEGNGNIRKVDTKGIISTIAGTGTLGFSGDGGPAILASITPDGLAVDSAGNIFICTHTRVREISGGIIRTIAGNGNSNSEAGDGGLATAASLGCYGVVVDAQDNVFIPEGSANRVRKISAAGTITTVAGDGNPGYSGDGGPAGIARVQTPNAVAVSPSGDVWFADTQNNAIRTLHPISQSLAISAVLDAATESAMPLSPGKVAVIYGAGLGPSTLAEFQLNGSDTIAAQLAGTTVTFNGIAAPLIYTSATQIGAIVPYGAMGNSAQVAVSYGGQTSTAVTVAIAPSAPGIFTLTETGAGQAAAVNQDGTINSAANPAKVGSYLSLYATGEGQTAPAGVDGQLATSGLPHPLLTVTATIGGQPASVSYAGAAPGEVAGLMQVNVQIPGGIPTGGYVPVVLQVGNAVSSPGVTIAVRN